MRLYQGVPTQLFPVLWSEGTDRELRARLLAGTGSKIGEFQAVSTQHFPTIEQAIIAENCA